MEGRRIGVYITIGTVQDLEQWYSKYASGKGQFKRSIFFTKTFDSTTYTLIPLGRTNFESLLSPLCYFLLALYLVRRYNDKPL